MSECRTCNGDEMIPLREHVVDCDCGGRDGGNCVMCKGKGHMSAFQKNDWVEKFDDVGKSLGNAYVFHIGADGFPVVCHEAKPASWNPDRLALIRRQPSQKPKP